MQSLTTLVELMLLIPRFTTLTLLSHRGPSVKARPRKINIETWGTTQQVNSHKSRVGIRRCAEQLPGIDGRTRRMPWTDQKFIMRMRCNLLWILRPFPGQVCAGLKRISATVCIRFVRILAKVFNSLFSCYGPVTVYISPTMLVLFQQRDYTLGSMIGDGPCWIPLSKSKQRCATASSTISKADDQVPESCYCRPSSIHPGTLLSVISPIQSATSVGESRGKAAKYLRNTCSQRPNTLENGSENDAETPRTCLWSTTGYAHPECRPD